VVRAGYGRVFGRLNGVNLARMSHEEIEIHWVGRLRMGKARLQSLRSFPDGRSTAKEGAEGSAPTFFTYGKA